MPTITQQPVTSLRDNIYKELDTAGITTITRSGQFAGVLISLGDLDPKLAKRLGDVTTRNPEHGLQLLLDYITYRS
ncbi:hypothetical protein [Fodinibius sp. SL11]|uniref:hypothetical protein n=1 Tax=Fodinibius sp. SL11 TaxID=3425690 RepID=UPI003F882342